MELHRTRTSQAMQHNHYISLTSGDVKQYLGLVVLIVYTMLCIIFLLKHLVAMTRYFCTLFDVMEY